jgi:hypothetical protein
VRIRTFEDSIDLEIVEIPSSLSDGQQTENELKAKKSKKCTVYRFEQTFETASEFNAWWKDKGFES